MKYIRLSKKYYGEKFYVATDAIICIERNTETKATEIKIAHVGICSVKETPVEILKLIAECEDN